MRTAQILIALLNVSPRSLQKSARNNSKIRCAHEDRTRAIFVASRHEKTTRRGYLGDEK